VELGRYLRRHAVADRLPAHDAERCSRAFGMLGVETYPTAPLLDDAFALRDDLTFDDALSVALARRLGEPLATTDRRLARAAADIGVAVARV
jgi:predicted nucleic acid-binding protein